MRFKPQIKPRLLPAIATVLLSLSIFGCAPGYAVTTERIPLKIGDSTIDLVLHESTAKGLTYLNLHDDENTSVKAALDTIRRYGGRVFELKHSGKRNITFLLDGIRYEFDPNRMFTDVGREASLARFGLVNEAAISALRSFADRVLHEVQAAELVVIVTLHNNTQGGYSTLSYTTGGDYAGEAQSVSISKDMDVDDFYFVTDEDIYNKLVQRKQNVVLQDNLQATDDGSLSVWSAQQNVPYINIEGQNNHRRAQADMAFVLHELFYLGREQTAL